MKHKTSEMTGVILDAAVAKAGGFRVLLVDGVPVVSNPDHDAHPTHYPPYLNFTPSTNWAHGGPIIERERITVQAAQAGDWRAFLGDGTTNAGTGRGASEPMIQARGEVPLIAAMRAYVAYKLGDEVEL